MVISALARYLAWYVLFLVRCILWPVTTVRALLQKKQPCPPIKDRLLTLPATELARRIRTRQVTCEEVIQAYINRIKEVNPILNAIVQERFEEAIQEAKEVDVYLSSKGVKSDEELQRSRPLLGVPVTIKETLAIKGMSNNAGFSRVQSRIADEDSHAVQALKDAGAIPLLVSNTPELCMSWETYNIYIGRTNNPYDTRRTPGGSSGGEAALLGSGASVVSVASDVCGSLRLPAMFTCVYGHKPSPGYVCNRGHRPNSADHRWKKYFTVGPMCRYAVDLSVMLKVLIADEEKVKPLRLDEQVDLSKVRLFYMDDDGSSTPYTDPVNPEIKNAMRRAVTYLQTEHGMTVQKASIKGLIDVMHYTTFIITRMKGIPNVYQKDDDHPDEWLSVVGTIWDRIRGKNNATFPPLLYGPLKAMADSISEKDYECLVKKTEEYIKQFKEMLGDDGVFFYPTFPEPAHYHDQIYYKILNTAYLSIFNLFEMPATACPLGLSSQGLPIGMQIATMPNQDRLSFAVAKALESHFGGWIPPCPVS